MNAGAFGTETWPAVGEVETVDTGGRRRWRTPSEYRYAYRDVDGPQGEWFVACRLELAADTAGEAPARIRHLLGQRNAQQPTGARSCGSVFRNPPGDHAGRLIEASGLKGRRVGGAVVSDKHANFIINDAGARAADVEALIGEVVDTVAERQGVRSSPRYASSVRRRSEARRNDRLPHRAPRRAAGIGACGIRPRGRALRRSIGPRGRYRSSAAPRCSARSNVSEWRRTASIAATTWSSGSCAAPSIGC